MAETLRDSLNRASPQQVADLLRLLQGGDALNLLPRTGIFVVVAASGRCELPESAKARAILRCYVSAGGVTGYFIPQADDATPGTGEVCVAPTGDIQFLGADAVTEAEITYVPVEGEVFEDTVDVAASAATLLQGRRAIQLLEVEVLTGAIPGVLDIDDRGTAAGAGEATLDIDGNSVDFNAADVVAGTARIRYVAFPGTGETTGVLDPIGETLNADVDF